MASPAVPIDIPSRGPSPLPATPVPPGQTSHPKGRQGPLKKPPQPQLLAERVRQDKWNASPPQITSYLTYPKSEPTNSRFEATYESPSCGLGWRFQLQECFIYQTSSLMPRTQELVGQVGLTFLPHLCSSGPLGGVKVNVKVSYPMDKSKSVHEKEFTGISVQSSAALGTYMEPPRYQGQTHIEITLTINPSDDLCLPTTPSVNTRMALHHSLDGPTFVDAKFYLFSARVQGRPALPKAVFAKSVLLTDGSSYLRDLLTPGAGFAGGTQCDLRKDVPEELAKLDPDAFEYDSDSDLEDYDDDEELDMKGKGKAPEAPSAHDRYASYQTSLLFVLHILNVRIISAVGTLPRILKHPSRLRVRKMDGHSQSTVQRI
ncbi:hypothetical protein P691DRAFT_536454 [Macrolepiota fuliginosa MF-IS2]|uniref:Uncharacterized protein n=1 Tax=Macrolepiota fuliginosa MF-IS2 TaxID=1400762 RepID=A0A9P5WZP4_9AGAR|nr:hypothetical protein P691DRAFT_536454 [Macrolepiota fuliginosa MF-IS2]